MSRTCASSRALRVAQVGDDRAGRRRRRRRGLEAVAGQRRGRSCSHERLARARRLERPRVDARDARRRQRAADSASTSDAVGGEQLLRPEHRELGGERLRVASAPANSAAANSPVETSRNARPQPSAPRRARDGGQERRLARVEIAGVGERARRDDAHDLALDEPLALRGSSTCSQIATR